MTHESDLYKQLCTNSKKSVIQYRDHIDYPISRYRPQIYRAYDIGALTDGTISATNARPTPRVHCLPVLDLPPHTQVTLQS